MKATIETGVKVTAYLLYLAEGPYGPGVRHTKDYQFGPGGFDPHDDAQVAARCLDVQGMYSHAYTHWWLLGRAGELADLRQWLVREGKVAATPEGGP